MAIIKPTLTLVSNASDYSVTAEQGPLSVALDLSTTVDITTVGVNSGRKLVSAAEAGAASDYLFDGSVAEDVDGGVAGTDGCYLYLKNMTAAGGTGDIYIGIEADDADLTDAADLSAGEAAARLFTLKPQEFAFFPYDFTMDISVDSSGSNIVLEWWKFDRTGTTSAYVGG